MYINQVGAKFVKILKLILLLTVNSDLVDAKNIYSLSPRLEAWASWLTQVNSSGNLEAIFPAATREYSPLVEELWKDKAFQSIYKRRNELDMLPAVANYFLDRVRFCSLMSLSCHKVLTQLTALLI